MKMKMESQTLPEELLIEILLRLPVKSLARFKCVSKPWLSLISNPHFTQSHLDLNHARNQRLLLFSEFYLNMVSIDLFNSPSLHDDSATSPVKLNFPLRQYFYPVRIVGSCRGLLLLECCCPNLLIWNPCTGFYRKLPSCPIYSYRYSFLFGLGFDPSTEDFLVTLATWELSKEEDDNAVIRVQTFSSRANTWREFEGSNLSYINVSGSSNVGLHFSGAIHWLAHHVERSADIIVVFDLVQRVFSEIALPKNFDCDINSSQLRVLGGCLGICAERDDDTAGGIWVMEEYKMESSWTKCHVIIPPCDIPTRCFSPICFARNDDIVGLDTYTELVKFNDKGDVLEHRRYCDHQADCDCDFIAVMLTESLISIPCGS